MKIFINGKFLSQKITGVQRYAIEVTKAMDSLLKARGSAAPEVILLAPADAIQHLHLSVIRTVAIGGKGGMYWSQVTAPLYARRRGGVLLTITGQCPVLAPDYLVFHDIVYLRYPESNSRAYRFVYQIDYKLTLKRCRRIFAVSGFTRDEVAEAYGLDKSRILVAYNASSHMEGRTFREVDLSRWDLAPDAYFLSVGSVNAHKNQRYILKLAERFPSCKFVIAGNAGGKTFRNADGTLPTGEADGGSEVPANVIFTGYLEDDALASLYRNAKGFIFPSKYEGFGIPPLEAITLGAKHVAVSDIPVFHEVYDRGVYYFDPEDPAGFDMEQFAGTRITPEIRSYYEKRFNWKKTAGVILDGILEAESQRH